MEKSKVAVRCFSKSGNTKSWQMRLQKQPTAKKFATEMIAELH